jgi:hypothetical protein
LYCVGDPFSEIENEFLNFSTNYNYICLFGDFNARTAEEPDFVETNYDEFSGMLDIDNEGIDMLNFVYFEPYYIFTICYDRFTNS